MNLEKSAASSKPLSVFALVMINVIAVDSLRNLTMGAEYGLALVFFYALAAILFFIPSVLISAELATGWPITGGAYIWIREAFGAEWGFLSIWLQWIYNVVWYPTIFAFIAGILAYLFDPQLVDNKTYMLSVILLTFWGMTLVNCLGIKISSLVSMLGAIFGTIVPMLFIAALGGFWIYSGRPLQFDLQLANFLPKANDFHNLAFMTNILFGLMGMEMSAVHAGDVKNPKKDYPRALAYSTIIILSTLVLSSLAIATVVPISSLNLVSGLIEAFNIFFAAYNLAWLVPALVILIVVGSLSCAAAWIIGPARGLLVASKDSHLPAFFKKTNRKNAPIGILIAQGLIVSFLCLVFLIMPTIKSSYWLLSNLTAQLALIFYVMLFAAAFRLRFKCANVKRSFKIPGGTWGIGLVCGLGIATCLTAIGLGFLPPSQIPTEMVGSYELLLVLGILGFCLPPFIFRAVYKRK